MSYSCLQCFYLSLFKTKSMKKLKFILVIVVCVNNICGQINLVPNGSFEQYTQCPNSTGQTSYTNNWFWAGASTDYYNTCSPQGNMSIPENIYGYQNSADGSAYIGMNLFAYYESQSQFYIREPISSALTSALQIGTKYFVSFKVSLTLNNFESCCAVNKIGARFTTFPYTDANGLNPAPINNFAHIYSNAIVTDTSNWTTISGNFIADSSYTYITLGNFFDSTQITMIDYFNNYPQTSASYYYFDDVRVSLDSIFVNSLNKINTKDGILIYPNPSNGKVEFNQLLIGKNIEIFDLAGRKVFTDSIQSNFIDLSFLNSGIYFIKIENKDVYLTHKLAIQK